MLIIPTQPLPNQTIQASLNNQSTQLNIYQTQYQMVMDVLLNGTAIVQGQPCQNLNLIVRLEYLGFQGDFTWLDTQGTDDPIYTGIGTRFLLVYLTPTDIAGLALPAGES